MNSYKAYKFRIYPNESQKELINKTFGCNRFVYNFFLSKIIENKYTKATKNITDEYDTNKWINEI